MNALDLGSITRPYEMDSVEVINGERVRGAMPQHRHDDKVRYMRPDKDDCMEVLADCGKHIVLQSRSDLFAGIAAPCKKVNKFGYCVGTPL